MQCNAAEQNHVNTNNVTHIVCDKQNMHKVQTGQEKVKENDEKYQ